MTAAGIDLGGTKIEARLFDGNWQETARKRVETPDQYEQLVEAMAMMIAWSESEGGVGLPIGIGAAGLVDPETGLALTANLSATGHPFPSDISRAAGRDITYVNDCRALALSEAVFGNGKGHRSVMSLNLGTGVAGGLAIDGHLISGPSQTGGEYGHMSAPAAIVAAHGLPIWECGCGRTGCIETYISGRGLARLGKSITGKDLTAEDIAEGRHDTLQEVWQIWCELTAELIVGLTLTDDPDVIILGGGLSRIPGVEADLQAAANRRQIGAFKVPPIVLAQGGDASGARGAAYAAWQDQEDA